MRPGGGVSVCPEESYFDNLSTHTNHRDVRISQGIVLFTFSGNIQFNS